MKNKTHLFLLVEVEDCRESIRRHQQALFPNGVVETTPCCKILSTKWWKKEHAPVVPCITHQATLKRSPSWLMYWVKNIPQFQNNDFEYIKAPIFASKYALSALLENLQTYPTETLNFGECCWYLQTLRNVADIFTKISDFANRSLAKMLNYHLYRGRNAQLL